MTLILALLASSKSFGQANEAIDGKRLWLGDKAPFTGVLITDEALRSIDTALIDKDICEGRIKSAPSLTDPLSDMENSVLAGAVGFILGGFVVYAATK